MYTTYTNQHPIHIQDLLHEHNNNIIIHLKGNIESNLDAITKYQDMEEIYSRNVNETYIFSEVTEAISFLNCETNTSLFCVLFNQSLNNDDDRYHPLITGYHLSSESISFNLETNYELECTETSRRIVDDLHYIENLHIIIIGESFNIEIINDILQPKLIPSDINLIFKNLKINNKLSNGYAHLISIGAHLPEENIDRIYPQSITGYVDKINVKDTDILVTIEGHSHSCHETTTHYHNTAYKFKNLDVLKEFLEVTVRDDEFFFIFNESDDPYGSFDITEETSKFVVRIDNDMDQWSDNLVIHFYYRDKKIGKKIRKYLDEKID